MREKNISRYIEEKRTITLTLVNNFNKFQLILTTC